MCACSQGPTYIQPIVYDINKHETVLPQMALSSNHALTQQILFYYLHILNWTTTNGEDFFKPPVIDPQSAVLVDP